MDIHNTAPIPGFVNEEYDLRADSASVGICMNTSAMHAGCVMPSETVD